MDGPGERPTRGEEAYPSFIFWRHDPQLNRPHRTIRIYSITRPAAAFRLLRACFRAPLLALLALVCLAPALRAQEPPYFVTYSQVLEEPGNLEIAEKSLTAAPKDANSFLASTFEFEYGATAWWTTEV